MNIGAFSWLGLLAVTWTTSCGNVALSMLQSKTPFIEDPDSPLANLVDRCGASMSDLQNPDYYVLVADFKSLPISVSGVKDDLKYTVGTTATAHITAKAGSSQTDTTVTVTSMTGVDNAGTVLLPDALNKFVKPEADNNTKDSTGSVTSTATGSTTIFRLSRQEGQFKNMLCAVSFTASQSDSTGGTVGQIRFDQATPLALNPKASPATYEKELGAGRTFTSNVQIVQPKTGWIQSGSVPIQVTWKKVSPDLNQSSQVTGQTFTGIKADVAYEVTVTASGAQPYQVGLSKRRVFYIDTTSKRLAAIVEDSGKLQSGKTDLYLPPAVMVAQ